MNPFSGAAQDVTNSFKGFNDPQLSCESNLTRTPPEIPRIDNKLGATIFLGYILAALILTIGILRSLRKSYNVLPPQTKKARSFRFYLISLSTLALISFALISFNMLGFLYLAFVEMNALDPSFQTWSLKLRFSLWLFTSSFFLQFSQSLLASKDAWTYLRVSVATVSSAQYLFAHAGLTLSIPSLAKYALLAQILPPSFSLILFSIAILLHRAAKQSNIAVPPHDGRRSLWGLPWWQYIMWQAYHYFVPSYQDVIVFASTLGLPCFLHTPGALMTGVGTLRLMLVLVWIPALLFGGSSPATRVSVLPFWATVTALSAYEVPLNPLTWASQIAAETHWPITNSTGYAAATMGWDALLCAWFLRTFGVWFFVRGWFDPVTVPAFAPAEPTPVYTGEKLDEKVQAALIDSQPEQREEKTLVAS